MNRTEDARDAVIRRLLRGCRKDAAATEVISRELRAQKGDRKRRGK